MNRYVGRFEGAGVDDSLSGPSTIASVLSGPALIVDPVSFPWGSAEEKHWRSPVLFDLTKCSADDLTALLPVMTVATPNDRFVADPETAATVCEAFALPTSCVSASVPAEPLLELEPLIDAKMHDSLLREVLAPIIRVELGSIAGFGDDAQRPLDVADLTVEDQWRSTFVPEPHRYTTFAGAADLPPDSFDLVLVAGAGLDTAAVRAIIDALHPGRMMVVMLSLDDVARVGGTTAHDVMATIESVTGKNRLIEHIWGLHSRPGRPTLGGIMAIRPLGARPSPRSESS